MSFFTRVSVLFEDSEFVEEEFLDSTTYLFSPVRLSRRARHIATAMIRSDTTVPAYPTYGIH